MLHRAVAQGPGEASQGDSRCKWGHIRGPEATSQMSLSAESGSDYDYEYEEGEEEEDEYDVASESAGEGDAGTGAHAAPRSVDRLPLTPRRQRIRSPGQWAWCASHRAWRSFRRT